MKAILLFFFLFVLANCQTDRCDISTVTAAQTAFATACTSEISAAHALFSVATDIDVPEARTIVCSAACAQATTIFTTQFAGCARALDIDTGSGIDRGTSERVLIALRLSCLRDEEPVRPRLEGGGFVDFCPALRRLAIRRSVNYLLSNCSGVVDAASVCNQNCLQTRVALTRLLSQCRDYPGVIDEIIYGSIRARLRIISEVCERVERAHDIAFCQAHFDASAMITAAQNLCGATGCSVQCREFLHRNLELFSRCARLYFEANAADSTVATIDHTFLNRIVDLRTRCAIRRASVLATTTDTSVDLTYEDSVSHDRPSTRTTIDNTRSVSITHRRRLSHRDANPAEEFRLRIRKVIEFRRVVPTSNDDYDTRGFDELRDEIISEFDFDTTPPDCEPITDFGTEPIDPADPGSDGDLARFFRTACRFGPTRLSRFIANVATASRETGRFGERCVSGGTSFTLRFEGLPNTRTDATGHVIVIDLDHSVAADTDVLTRDVPTPRIGDDGIRTEDVSEDEYRFSAHSAVRWRRLVYCDNDKTAIIRVRRVVVTAETPDNGFVRRVRLFITVARSGEPCYELFWDPASDAENPDPIPAPEATDVTPGTGTGSTPNSTPNVPPNNSVLITFSLLITLLIALF